MCGFAGFLATGGLPAEAGETARAMADAIRHRGPDGDGVWLDNEAGIALAHRRLAIVDLSPAGQQPMASASGRFIIVFNGEIYNHADIRKRLEADGKAPAWRGHSDTEVLLECIAAEGVERTIEACAGMFAFALWDRGERTLTLARDRFGEKPLYYGWAGQTFLFGSELAALARHPHWTGEIDRDAVATMMRYNNVPAPKSIYSGISKLEPGRILALDTQSREPRISTYWDMTSVARDGAAQPFSGTADEANDEVERLLKQSLAGQMMADVPLGAFLSGGIDSSTVVALMQEMGSAPVQTFSIGFSEARYDEAVHARTIARHLGTDHREMIVSPEEARGVIPDLPRIYSEPFADSSQIPTYLVAKLARQHVTVSLSGDAGDEVFCGYRRYAYAADVWPKLAPLPRALRSAAANTIRGIKPRYWDAVGGRQRHAGDRLHKAARVMSLNTLADAYSALVSHWDQPEDIVIGANQSAGATDETTLADPVREMMLRDTNGYLSDDILVKVDRASMAVSLESRIPLLDHRLVAFAWTLPVSMLRRDGKSKAPLRNILYRRVPKELVERPKAGFAIPLGAWLRGPLREWAETLLAHDRLQREGFFQPAPIRDAWHQLLSGEAATEERIWNVLMFQAWFDAGRGGAARSLPHQTAIAGG